MLTLVDGQWCFVWQHKTCSLWHMGLMTIAFCIRYIFVVKSLKQWTVKKLQMTKHWMRFKGVKSLKLLSKPIHKHYQYLYNHKNQFLSPNCHLILILLCWWLKFYVVLKVFANLLLFIRVKLFTKRGRLCVHVVLGSMDHDKLLEM